MAVTMESNQLHSTTLFSRQSFTSQQARLFAVGETVVPRLGSSVAPAPVGHRITNVNNVNGIAWLSFEGGRGFERADQYVGIREANFTGASLIEHLIHFQTNDVAKTCLNKAHFDMLLQTIELDHLDLECISRESLIAAVHQTQQGKAEQACAFVTITIVSLEKLFALSDIAAYTVTSDPELAARVKLIYDHAAANVFGSQINLNACNGNEEMRTLDNSIQMNLQLGAATMALSRKFRQLSATNI